MNFLYLLFRQFQSLEISVASDIRLILTLLQQQADGQDKAEGARTFSTSEPAQIEITDRDAQTLLRCVSSFCNNNNNNNSNNNNFRAYDIQKIS